MIHTVISQMIMPRMKNTIISQDIIYNQAGKNMDMKQ